MKLPQNWQKRCANCRYRVQAQSGDRKAFYHTCHAAPPLMLPEGGSADSLLRTWFPIVVDEMWCSMFRYAPRQTRIIVASTICVVALAVYLAIRFGV